MDPPASQVNLNIVKEAEIYKGPYQFRFGNSFGGTINFVSIDPKFTEKPVFSGRLSTGYETNGYGTRNELITRLSTRKFNIDLFGSYQKPMIIRMAMVIKSHLHSKDTVWVRGFLINGMKAILLQHR